MKKFIVTEKRLRELLLAEAELIAIDNCNGAEYAEYCAGLYTFIKELEHDKKYFPEEGDDFRLVDDVITNNFEEYKES